jgi:hypothetical protein
MIRLSASYDIVPGVCNIMAMGLLYKLALWSMCACVEALDPMVRDQ